MTYVIRILRVCYVVSTVVGLIAAVAIAAAIDLAVVFSKQKQQKG